MAVRVTLMMASRGLMIFGSGTSVTRTSCFPYQQTAFMRPTPFSVKLCRGDLARLQNLFEPLQIFLDLLRRREIHQFTGRSSGCSPRWQIGQLDGHLRTPPSRCFAENDA